MKITRDAWKLTAAVAVCLLLSLATQSKAELTHRWSFDTDASDSVGSLDWNVNGATVGGGAVTFDGIDDFLELTNTPLPTSGSTTIEVWGTYDPASPTGSRIFDFSSADGDLFFFLTPNAQNTATQTMSTAVSWDDEFNDAIEARGGGSSNTGNEVLLTVVYDATADAQLGPGEFRLYRDGRLLATQGTQGLNILGFEGSGTTTVNRLGHGESNTTPAYAEAEDIPPDFLSGAISEFRTYNNALTPDEVIINAIAGPDNPDVNLADTTWNVAGSGDWNVGGNWSATSVPNDGQRAIIDNGGTANVTTAVPQVGSVSIGNGTLTVDSGGTLNSQYPIILSTGEANTATVNVNSGGQLTFSQLAGDTGGGAKALNINGGTISPNYSSTIIVPEVPVNIGAGGATFNASSGNVLQVQSAVTGDSEITIEGEGTTGFVGGAENTFTGEVVVNNSTLSLATLDRVSGGFDSFNMASGIVLNNATIEAIPSGGGGNEMRTPWHISDGTDNAFVHVGIDATAEREPWLRGDMTGDGTLHYTSDRTVPIGLDIGGVLAVDPEGCTVGEDGCTIVDETDNSGFTGRLVIDDVSGNAEGMFIAVRFRSEFGDLPNAIIELNSPGSRLGKRGDDENQTIQLGGVSGVAGTFLHASVAGETEESEFRDLTYELGGASENAEFFGTIRDTPHAQEDSPDHNIVTVVKVGSNTQALSGANSYSGTTTVNEGTLLINGTHSQAVFDAGGDLADPANYDGLPVGDYTVNAGGTLGGTSTIGSATDSVDVAVLGGTLAPGASPGTLTLNGNYSQDSDSTLAIEIGGNPASGMFDLLDISGSASLDGMLDVSLFGNPSLTVGDEFTVLNANSVSGTLDLTGSAASAFDLTVTGNSLILEYLGGGVVDVDLNNDGRVDGLDFLLIQRTDPSLLAEWRNQYGTGTLQQPLTNVPEPGTLTLGACMIGLLGVASRLRRS